MSVPDPKASHWMTMDEMSRPQGALPQEIIQMILATKPVLLPAGVRLPSTCDMCGKLFVVCRCRGFDWSAKRGEQS